MQHRFAPEVIDRTLRDFMNQPDLFFGGITVVFEGDFQQTLPIISKGTKEQMIGACIQRSRLWRYIKVLHLTENMPNDQQSAQFEQWLLDVRQGKNLPLNHQFTLHQYMICGVEATDLTRAIYPNFQNGEALTN